MRQLIGYAMSLLVLLTGAYAFAPRPPASMPATALHLDRVQINDLQANAGHLIAVGERGTLLLSADRGLSWQQARLDTPHSATLTAVSVISPDLLLAVGHDGWILRSTDAGKTWQQVRYDAESGEPLFGILAADPQRIVAYGSYGRMLESRDQGLSWQAVELDVDGAHLNGLAGAADGRQILVGEQGLVMRSRDHGLSWEHLPAFYQGSLFGIARLSAERWVAYGMRGHVFISDDFGSQWRPIDVGHTLAFYGHLTLPDNGGVLIVGANGARLQLNNDGQLLQNQQAAGLGVLTSAVLLDPRSLWLGGEFGVAPSTRADVATLNRGRP